MLAETVRAAASRFGGATVFVDPDGTPLSFAGLDVGSDAVAAGLAARGLGPGDRLVLRLPSTSRYVLAYAAAAKLAAVTAGVNPVLAAPEQDRLTELADPRLVLTDPAEVDELAAAGARLLAAGTATPPAPLPADANRPVAIGRRPGDGRDRCRRRPARRRGATHPGRAARPPGPGPGPLQAPEDVRVVTSLPLTAVHKFDRAALAAQLTP
jgi:acyl-CoA synthetase (AMP-forming)/AMP-acid ligase II